MNGRHDHTTAGCVSFCDHADTDSRQIDRGTYTVTNGEKITRSAVFVSILYVFCFLSCNFVALSTESVRKSRRNWTVKRHWIIRVHTYTLHRCGEQTLSTEPQPISWHRAPHSAFIHDQMKRSHLCKRGLSSVWSRGPSASVYLQVVVTTVTFVQRPLPAHWLPRLTARTLLAFKRTPLISYDSEVSCC